MKATLRVLFVLFLLQLGSVSLTIAQCADDNALTPGNLTPSDVGVSNVQYYVTGQYMLAYVEAGSNYTITTCGSTSFDSQLTVFDVTSGSVLAYNDDYCGLQSTVNFIPGSCGYVKVALDQYFCNNTGITAAVIMTQNAGTSAITNSFQFNPSFSAICNGDSVLLFGSGVPKGIYSWSAGVTDSTWIDPDSSIYYTVVATDTIGCSISDSVKFKINALPNVVANISTPNTICLNDTAFLYGSGAATYVWTGGVTDSVTFTPTASDTYTVTGTDTNGCINTASQLINVTLLPVVTANAISDTVCIGDDVTLFGAGASTYVWSGGIDDNTAFTSTASDTFIVVGTDANGCISKDSLFVKVNDLPIVTALTSSPTNICRRDTVFLYGQGAATYTWTGGVSDSVAFIPTNTDSYIVTGTDSNGCKNTATSPTITVRTLPSVIANASSTSICAGEEVNVFASGDAISYVWKGGETDNVDFVPTSTATYVVTGTGSNGCVDTSFIEVVVNLLPNVTANTTTPSICNGDGVILYGGGAATYTWTGGVTDNSSFNPTADDTYTVTGKDANGCENTASQSITVKARPSNATTLSGNTITATETGATYEWISECGSSNATISGQSGQTYTPTATGSYAVIVTASNGCDATSNCVTITLTGIQSVEEALLFTIYPNPNTGAFTIKTSNTAEGSYRLVNELGQTVHSFKLDESNNFTANIEGINNGIFVISSNNKNKIVNQKIVVTK